MKNEDIVEYIDKEIKRLFPANIALRLDIKCWDIDAGKGFTMITLKDNLDFLYRGYSKRCNYAPVADKHNDRIGLSVALSHILHRYRFERRKE